MIARRIVNLFRGFFGLFVSGVERSRPEALLEVEKENLRKQVARYNEGLASHAALCERLMAQVRKLEGDERDLRARTAANVRAGNRDAAGQYALRLQSAVRELADNRVQLTQAEETYRSMVSARDMAVRAAREKIEALRQGIDDMKVKRAMAELTEMASGMVGRIGSAGDTLDRLHQMVQEERERAAGRVRVARDGMNLPDVQTEAAEQRALAEQALEDFLSEEAGRGARAAGGVPPVPPAIPEHVEIVQVSRRASESVSAGR